MQDFNAYFVFIIFVSNYYILRVVFIAQCKYIFNKTFEVLSLSFFYSQLKKIGASRLRIT